MAINFTLIPIKDTKWQVVLPRNNEHLTVSIYHNGPTGVNIRELKKALRNFHIGDLAENWDRHIQCVRYEHV